MLRRELVDLFMAVVLATSTVFAMLDGNYYVTGITLVVAHVFSRQKEEPNNEKP